MAGKVLSGPPLQLWFQQNSNTSVGTSSSASGSRVHLTHRYTVPDNLTDTLGPSYSHLHSDTENYRESGTHPMTVTHRVTHSQTKPLTLHLPSHTYNLPGSSQHPAPRASIPTPPRGRQGFWVRLTAGLRDAFGRGWKAEPLEHVAPGTEEAAKTRWVWSLGWGGVDVGRGLRQRGNVSGAPPRSTRPGQAGTIREAGRGRAEEPTGSRRMGVGWGNARPGSVRQRLSPGPGRGSRDRVWNLGALD